MRDYKSLFYFLIILLHLVAPHRSVVSCSEMLSCLLQDLLSCKRMNVCVCGKDSMSTAGLCSNRQQSRNECRHCEPQSDWSHLVRFSSIILYFRFSHCLYTFTRRRVHRETLSFLWGLIMNTQLYQTSLYLSLCVCVCFFLLSSTICKSWGTVHLWLTKSSFRETTVKEPPASFRPSSPLSWRAGWVCVCVCEKGII